ncbi:hypothetical protein [Desulfoscipio sp. XC116]|uniref:hypothetical protein n=1 Tax=Desulfoscipio sp. XC116 TaxID=3144975 RepID=UPI00325B9329
MTSFFNSLLNRVGLAQKLGEQTKETTATAVKDADAFLKIVDVIDDMVTQGETRLKKMEDDYAVIYMLGDRKILHITKNADPPRTFFLYSGANRAARGMDVPGLRVISKNEAKQKKYGSVKAVYTGTNADVVKDMLKKMESDKTA